MSLITSFHRRTVLSITAIVGAFAVASYLLTSRRKAKRKSRIIDMIEEFKKGNVYIKDKERVERLVCNLIQGGKEKLQVIVDFDRTLSRYNREDGTRNNCSFNALDESHLLPQFYREKALPLRDHYYAIEVDPSLTLEEKYPFMVEWWTKAHGLLMECHLNQDMIKHIVQEAQIVLRDGTEWLFSSLHKAEVPLLIFSAGVGDVIDEVIHQNSHFFSNMKIVSNFIDFNEEGKMVGFKGELIHVFNKNESAIHKSDYFENISHRENIILMGDSLGDLKMAEGAVNCKNLLKIGFLNDKVEKLLPTYMDLYDIVLVCDESMEIPNAILSKVL